MGVTESEDHCCRAGQSMPSPKAELRRTMQLPLQRTTGAQTVPAPRMWRRQLRRRC